MGWGWGVHCIGSRKVTALNRHISVIVSTLTSWFRKSTYLISILSSLKRKLMAKFSSSKRCLQDLVCWTRKCNRECTMSMHFSKPQPKGRTRFIVNNFFFAYLFKLLNPEYSFSTFLTVPLPINPSTHFLLFWKDAFKRGHILFSSGFLASISFFSWASWPSCVEEVSSELWSFCLCGFSTGFLL